MTQRKAILLCVLGALVVLLLGLRVRLPNLGGRPLGFDESLHAETALASPDFAALRRATAMQFQPLLDHCLRRYLWAPLLGTSELGIRLPALIASLLAILAAMGLAAWCFLENGRPPSEAVAAALAVGFWHAGYAQDIGASGFARHYALTELLSIVWVAVFVLGQPERAWRRFALASLVFMNTHFFSLAMIGTAYAWLALAHVTRKAWRAAGREVAVFVAMVLVTATLNWPALSALLYHPVEPRQLGGSALLPALAETWGLLVRMHQFLNLAVMPIGLWSLLVLGGGLGRILPRPQVLKVASLVGLAIPAQFLLGALRSAHYMESRYFMPFVGPAVLVLVLGALAVVELAHRVMSRLAPDPPDRLLRIAGLPLIVALVVGGIRLAAAPGSFAAPALPSRRAGLMDALKREDRPVFLLASPCWGKLVIKTYWNIIGTPAPADRLTISDQRGYAECVRGGFAPGSIAEQELQAFLERAPNGLVVLYQHHLHCLEPRFAPPARLITDSTDSSCLTVLDGLGSIEQARAAAVAVGYPATSQTLLEHRQSEYDRLHL